MQYNISNRPIVEFMFEGAMISANVQQKQQQQHQQQQQQQQVDNKKATNANYIRKSQINLAQYTQSSNNRNLLCENSYYGGIATDYQTAIDLSGNQLLSPQTTNVSSSTAAAIVAATNPAAAQLSSSTSNASNALSVDSTSTTNILNDQISVLFPKCRPKNDANLNKTSLYIDTTTHNNTALASASLLLASSPTHGDYKNQNQLFDDGEHIDNSTLIDNNRAYTRNMNNQNAADATLNDGGGGGGGTGEIMQNNIGGISETTSAPRMNHSGYPARCE